MPALFALAGRCGARSEVRLVYHGHSAVPRRWWRTWGVAGNPAAALDGCTRAVGPASPCEGEVGPLEVAHEEGRILLRVSHAASVSHVLAAIALELSKVGKPPEIHFGWSDEHSLSASLGFLLFGQGNVPQKVRELIRNAEPNPERRPRVIVG